MSKDLDFIDTFIDRKKPVKDKKDSEEQLFDDESGFDYEIDYTVQE